MPTTSSPTSPRLSSASSLVAIFAWLAVAAILVTLGFWATASGESDPNLLYDYSFAAGSMLLYGVLVGITLAIAASSGEPLEVAGLKRFPWRWVWIAIGLIILVLIVGQALEPVLHAGEKQGFEPKEWRPHRATAYALNAAVASLVVPFGEELFFRGVGVRVLLPFGAVGAIGVTGLVFGLGHGLLVALPILVPFGLVLGWVRWRADSVWPGMLAHGFYNGSALLYLFFHLS
jgi:membrane protease YdiL (CAAX protease family)